MQLRVRVKGPSFNLCALRCRRAMPRGGADVRTAQSAVFGD